MELPYKKIPDDFGPLQVRGLEKMNEKSFFYFNIYIELKTWINKQLFLIVQETHFVRCIKTKNVLNVFDEDPVRHQLGSSGSIAFFQLMAGIHPDRKKNSFQPFFKSKCYNINEIYFEILRTCGLTKRDLKIGKSEVFIRPGKINELLTMTSGKIDSLIARRDEMKPIWRRSVRLLILQQECINVILQYKKRMSYFETFQFDFVSITQKMT